jgi:hypothetical protein
MKTAAAEMDKTAGITALIKIFSTGDHNTAIEAVCKSSSNMGPTMGNESYLHMVIHNLKIR